MLFNHGFVRDATLVCWNVAGRLRRQAVQAKRVTALSPDIVSCRRSSPARCDPGLSI
jgi:hypothetical protein